MQRVPTAVVAALDDEIRVIRSKMSVDARIHVRPGLMTKGTYKQRPVLLVRTGVGRGAMRATIARMLESHAPELVIHTGYCGGAEPSLAPGDLVVADAVVDAKSKERIVTDPELVSKAKKLLDGRALRARIGALATVEDVAGSPHDKAFIATEHSSVAMDMESFDLARALSENSVPYLIVRSVLDPLDYELPNISGAIDAEGATDGLALAEHLIKKPSDMLKMPKLQFLATQARNSITAFIDAWLSEVES